MKSQGSRLLIAIVVVDLLILLAILGVRLINSNRSGSVALQNTSTPQTAPGLVVSGSVRSSNGTGVENVAIYINYASYPGRLIAATGASGDYKSDFYPIPGDEMVSVWAERSGVLFLPKLCYWRHYYGYETKTCDFVIQPVANIYLPILNRAQK
jgi:hypothetical protein